MSRLLVASQARFGLIVVPEAEAEELLVLVEELRLQRVAVVVLEAGAEQVVVVRAAPLPTPDDVHVAAEAKVFEQADIRAGERRTMNAGRNDRAELRAELELEGLGSADRNRIEVLTSSIREAEAQLQQEEFWSTRPKPTRSAPRVRRCATIPN